MQSGPTGLHLARPTGRFAMYNGYLSLCPKQVDFKERFFAGLLRMLVCVCLPKPLGFYVFI